MPRHLRALALGLLSALTIASASAQTLALDLLAEARDGGPGDFWTLPNPVHLASIGGSIAMLDTEEDGRFLRIKTPLTPFLSIDSFLEPPTGKTKIHLSVDMRAPSLTPTAEKSWANDARVMLVFLLADGTRRGATRAAALSSERQRWRTLTLSEDIPAGSTGLVISVGFFGATGEANFRSLQIRFE